MSQYSFLFLFRFKEPHLSNTPTFYSTQVFIFKNKQATLDLSKEQLISASCDKAKKNTVYIKDNKT